MKELKSEEPFYDKNLVEHIVKERISKGISIREPYTKEEFTLQFDSVRASKYIVMTNNTLVDSLSITALEGLRAAITTGISNDIVKYCMPECYRTELAWSVNIRSLQNFISLRSDKAALWEIRELAHKLFEALPEEHKYLFVDSLKEYNDKKD